MVQLYFGDKRENTMIKRIISEKQVQEIKEKAKFRHKKSSELTSAEIKEIVLLLAKQHGILKNE